MKLNLPFLDQLKDSQSILIAGAGGGFDVFSGLPIYFTLKEMGKTVHLANYSFVFTDLVAMACKVEVLLPDQLVGATARIPNDLHMEYYPEGYLSKWFKEVHQQDITIWMMPNLGALPLTEAYAMLTSHLQIDALILVDGGVDSIMRGDEEGAGTLIEDAISLAAVENLPIPTKILACIGFGTEVEEQVCHYNALQNIAALTQAGGFLGGCALTPQMPAFQQFEAACRYVWEQPRHKKSHITTRIIPAANGEFGNHQMYPGEGFLGPEVPILISPLMSLYWFFDVATVIERSQVIKLIRGSMTKREAFIGYARMGQFTIQRPRRSLPY